MSESYPGGKGGAGVYQTLINQVPPHRVYISATAGHDAVLRHIEPAERSIAVDLDRDVLAWWQNHHCHVETHQSCGLDFLELTFGLRRYHVMQPGELLTLGAGETLTCGDLLPQILPAPAASADEVFVLIDAPYPGDTRSGGRLYQFDQMEWEFHNRLLAVANRLPCNVMICCYPNERYDQALSGWRRKTYQAVVRSGEVRTECLWMNYDEPAELHDYSHLGTDRRDRERIKRQQRNLAARIKRMAPLERLAFVRTANRALDECKRIG